MISDVNNINSVEELEKKIDCWKAALKINHDPITGAMISESINAAYKRIEELKNNKVKIKINSQIDAPTVADKEDSAPVHLTRGQIMNSGDVFATIL